MTVSGIFRATKNLIFALDPLCTLNVKITLLYESGRYRWGGGGSKNNVHWTLSVAMVEFRVSPYTFRHFQRVQTHILLRSTFEVCKSSPNAGGGNYEYLAVVSDSLTRTNLAWKVGVEQSL